MPCFAAACRALIRFTPRWGSRSFVHFRHGARPLRSINEPTGWWSAKGRACSCSSALTTLWRTAIRFMRLWPGSACPTTSTATCWRPSSEGQLRAMRMAYEQAGWGPGDVDLIECHAAGTAVGDAVEAESLKSLWGQSGWNRGQCTIGSVKSNVGHALTAAGAAGLLKVLLALKHETLPPTANFERSAPALGLDESPFRVLTHADHWPRRAPDQPRRAAISGFGFGGINCHVLIEEWDRSGSMDTYARSNQVHADRDRYAISAPIIPLNSFERVRGGRAFWRAAASSGSDGASPFRKYARRFSDRGAVGPVWAI